MELIEQLKNWLQPFIDNLFPYIKEGWGLFNDYAYLRAGILIVISYFIARLLNKHIPSLLIDLAQYLNFTIGEEIAKLTRPLLFQVIFLSSLGLIVYFLELSPTEYFIVLASIKSLMIIAFIIFLYKLIKLTLQHLCEREVKEGSKIIQATTLPLFENIAILLLALAGIHQVFGVWNVDMTALLASAGIAGLAIGMASKDTLSDIIAGILILTDAPYRVGDVVQVGAEVGTVASIGIRSTRIITKDNVGITVPNGKMGASEVINESTTSGDTSLRIKLPVKAAYGVDPKVIRHIMLTAAQETDNVLKDKKISVVLSDFQSEQITFTLLCWIPEPRLKSGTLSALREKVYIHFLKDNIPIAAPNRREIEITKQADLKQQVAVTAIPSLDQTININKIPEIIQSISIKDMPELTHSVAIKELPELIQSVAIKDIPELIQSIVIKEMPDRKGSLSITEIPDLFGTGKARKIHKPEAVHTSKANDSTTTSHKASSREKDKE
jgi:small-conductance mechanosensitive channel